MGRGLLAALVVLVLAGCGDRGSIVGGGRVAGDRLTVYSFVPQQGPRAAAGRSLVLGEKLALAEADNRAAGFDVDFVARGAPVGRFGEPRAEAIADAVRSMVNDQALIAVIGDLDAGTARTSVPLLDAAGILHVSPGTAVSDAYANPSGVETFFSLAPDADYQRTVLRQPVVAEAEGNEVAQALGDAVQVGEPKRGRTRFYAGNDVVNARAAREPGTVFSNDFASTSLRPVVSNLVAPPAAFADRFADAYDGREADDWAFRGYEAMRGVLAALDAAGPKARERAAVIAAYADASGQPGPPRIVR